MRQTGDTQTQNSHKQPHKETNRNPHRNKQWKEIISTRPIWGEMRLGTKINRKQPCRHGYPVIPPNILIVSLSLAQSCLTIFSPLSFPSCRTLIFLSQFVFLSPLIEMIKFQFEFCQMCVTQRQIHWNSDDLCGWVCVECFQLPTWECVWHEGTTRAKQSIVWSPGHCRMKWLTSSSPLLFILSSPTLRGRSRNTAMGAHSLPD